MMNKIQEGDILIQLYYQRGRKMSQCCTRYTQTAVASFGPRRQTDCGQMPAGFTRVIPEVLNWIKIYHVGLNDPGEMLIV